MHSRRSIAFVFALLLLAAPPARAQGFLTPFIGFNFGGDSANCAALRNCEEHRTNFGVSIGARHGIFGVEQDIGYAPDFFGTTDDGDNAVLTVMTSLLVVVPAGPVQPYGLVGIGLIRPHMTFDASGLALNKNALGYDIGGGVNLFLMRSLGIRGDVRRMKTISEVPFGLLSDEKIEFWRGTAGVTFRF